MLKARRQHQKTRKLLDAEEKKAKKAKTEALNGPVVKKEKVKKVRVKKEKVVTEAPKVAKKPKPTAEEISRQSAKKPAAGTGKKG